jgi:hypothetical protein
MKPDVLLGGYDRIHEYVGLFNSGFDQIEAGFSEFLDEKIDDPNAEYYIPAMVDRLIRDGRAERQGTALRCRLVRDYISGGSSDSQDNSAEKN